MVITKNKTVTIVPIINFFIEYTQFIRIFYCFCYSNIWSKLKYSRGEAIILKFQKLSMQRKIMSLTFFILMLSFSIGGTFLLGYVMNEQKSKLSDQALLVAKTVSQLPEIKTYIAHENIEIAVQHINPVVEE